MKHVFSILFFLFFFIFSLSAESVTSLLSHPAEDYPLSNTIRWDDAEARELLLLPDDFSEADNIYSRFIDYHPQITIERLYRIKLPGEYYASNSESRLILFTKILNILGKPETLVGYTYHSSRKNKDIILIEESYISNKRGKRIEGFHFTVKNIPEKYSYYQFINDANSKGAVFEQKILVKDKFLGYQSTNIESVKIFIIPVMKNGGTRTEMVLFPSDGYLYIYNCSQILKEPVVKALGISVNVSSMFKKRMDVMAKWIADQLSEPES